MKLRVFTSAALAGLKNCSASPLQPSDETNGLEDELM